MARAVGYDEGVATYTGNLAVLALDREDWPAAESLAREALPMSEAIHRQGLIAHDNRRLAIGSRVFFAGANVLVLFPFLPHLAVFC